jgi:Protein of unknown function (Hypoth_ymh)
MADDLGLHPYLQPDCSKLSKDGHINESVRKALEKYEHYIQKKSGESKIGSNLMAAAFNENVPPHSHRRYSNTTGQGSPRWV